MKNTTKSIERLMTAGRVQASNIFLAMPAIYRLPNAGQDQFNDGEYEGQAWGWHRASELLRAVQMIHLERTEEFLTADEICSKYSQVNPYGHKGEFDTVKPDGMQVGTYTLSFGMTLSFRWLQHLVNTDCFLPASIGMHLINAVKHPVLSRLAG